MKMVLALFIILTTSVALAGKKKQVSPSPEPAFIPSQAQDTRTTGSLWTDQGVLADMAKDYKARKLNDIIMIRIVESTSATATGQAKTARAVSTSSAVTGFAGKLSAANNLQNLLGLNSNQTLNGQGAATTATSVNTQLAGRVVQVLPNGNMMIWCLSTPQQKS